ncbi:hypothetical protein, partial [Sphingobium sp. YR768]|uniref:hypothetical protein n=1 Tax=Sphingobium sp. YR768 TaxID=1884365 RepID=UPI0008B39771
MAIDDQLSSLLDRTGTILARQNDWADGQVMLLAGSKDDPDSYNAVGGKVGDLGYYPVRNVNGQTVYMPCIERQKVIADGNVAVVTAPAIKRTRGQLTLNEVGGRTDNDDNSELAAEWLDDCAKNQSEAILAKDSDLDGAPGTYFAKPILVNPKKPLKITGRPGTTIQGVTDVWANETDPVDSRA